MNRALISCYASARGDSPRASAVNPQTPPRVFWTDSRTILPGLHRVYITDTASCCDLLDCNAWA